MINRDLSYSLHPSNPILLKVKSFWYVCAILLSVITANGLSAAPACQQNEITQLNLVAAPSGTLISPLTNGYIINKANIPGSFNVDAIACNGLVGSVVFSINGSVFRTESAAPYALNGDKKGAFKSWNPSVGTYLITATPYSGSGGTGTAGIALSVSVQVVDQVSTTDCHGDLNGTASIDQCGICSGGNTGLVPNASCTDCNNEINGTAAVDNCGVCAGGSTGIVPDASCTDCAGVLNGTAAVDACGTCSGGTTGITPDIACQDCNGVPNGTAVIDSCGDCVLGNTGLAFNSGCNIDCNGVVNGTAAIDACGVCAGGTTGLTPDASCTDCNGEVNGTAAVDACGVCAGGNTGVAPDACLDCNSDPYGTAAIDSCGVCSGGNTGIAVNSTCTGCVPNQVISLVLMEAGVGGAALGNIQNGDVIIKSVVGPFSVDAQVCSDPAVESVVYNLNGSNIRTESAPPYAVNGDNASSGFKAWNVPEGTHTLTATPYSGNKGKGTAGTPLTVTFTVINQAPAVDCNGDLNGTALIDQCGICSGGNTGLVPNASCTDCNNEINGTATVDNCGVCAGGSTGIVPDASCTDCAGVLNGTAAVDACGTCSGGTTGITPDIACQDCNGVPNGTAVIDSCGDCVLGNTGLAFNSGCNIDCNGVVNGTAAIDACGVCAGGTTGLTPDASCTDCNGEVNGTAAVDACGVCAGGNTGVAPDACLDCNNDPYGTAAIDSCGVCSGGNTGIAVNSTCTGGGCVPNEIQTITLVDASNGQDVGPLSTGDTIDLSVLPSFSVHADPCSDPAVESVVFNLDGSNIRTESVQPYSVKGDNNGNYTPWPLNPGTYTLTTTPYSGNSGNGTQGVAKTVTFHVVAGPPAPDCNGDVGGTAYVDGCGNCVGGNTGNAPCTPTAGCGEFIETNGLVVVEMESIAVTSSNWYEGTGPVSGLNIPAPSGSYYMWKENCVSGSSPNYDYTSCGGTNGGNSGAARTYKINISSPGRYRLQIRSWQPKIKHGSHSASTENNDCWIQLPEGGGIKKKNSTEINIGSSEWVKSYQNNVNGWTWNTSTVDGQPHQILVDFPTSGTYTVKIAGRSKLFATDRFVLYRQGNASNNVNTSYATDLARPESPRGSCGGAKAIAGTGQTQNDNQAGISGVDQNTSNAIDLSEMGMDQLEISLYPNPTTGILNLEINSDGSDTRLEIYDATGKLMLKQTQIEEQTRIDLSGFANGIYWLRVNTDEAVQMQRIYKR